MTITHAAPNDVEEPERLLCPVTHVMYKDPVVVAGSGNTYERDAVLAHWRIRGFPQDPLNNVEVDNALLIANWDKRREVEAFLAANVDYVPQGWNSRQPHNPQDERQYKGRRRGIVSQAGRRWRQLLVDEVGDLLPEGKGTPMLLLVVMISCLVVLAAADIFLLIIPASAAAPAVVGIMRLAPSSPYLQERSCTALATIAGRGADERDDVAQVGGIDQILNALRNHPGAARVQGSACEALATVSIRSATSREAIARAGGVELVLSALQDHFWDARVLAQASAALANVAFGSPASQETAFQFGVVGRLVKALRAPHADAFVRESACLALRSLATGGAPRRTAIEGALADAELSCPSPSA